MTEISLPLIRTEVEPGDLPDYPDGVVPYGPANLTDESDSTGVKFLGDFPLAPTRWYVIFDAGAVSEAISITVRLRFKVNVGPFRFRGAVHDGTSQQDFGDVAEIYPWGLPAEGVLAPDGLSDHEITIDQAWLDANPSGYFSDTGAEDIGTLWSQLRSGDGQVWLYLTERSTAVGNSYDADLVEAALLVETGDAPPTYRRIFPRDDRRNWPRPKARQAGSRIGGGYL